MASGLIVLLLEGLYPKPNISISPSGVIPVGGNVIIRCWYHPYGGMRFHLYKDGDEKYLKYTGQAGSEAEFPISVSREQRGNYTCRYSTRTADDAYSAPSDPVQIIVGGGTEPTQPGMTLAPTHPGHTSQGESGSLNLTSHVIAGVSAAAAILLLLFLLLLAFVCFRKTRARKGSAPRRSSASPLGALKGPAQQEPVYDSVNEGKEPQTSPHKPDPDGLTYAELDHQVLHAKRGAPAPEPVQPSLYAAISTSQGATH